MGSDPRIAIVVPIFRHSVLLAEAVDAALLQQADFPIRVVLVNDGCPNRETHEVCLDFALAHPDRVTYLRKPNGGLSDARNFGIRHALDTWPGVEAIYMMDADNRLRPHSMARAMAELDAHPEAAWIYPNIDMFGLSWAGDYGGDYSVLLHTAMNVSEAGSLIRRSVFDAGVFFDTDFKSGFEDWDFFLTAAEAGFRGRTIEDFGFLYRKRPESMLADSERDAAAIRSVMREKHKALLHPRNLVALEQQEAPRYAILLSDRRKVLIATDPDAPGARMAEVEELEETLWRARFRPSRFHAPPFLVVTTSAVVEGLRAAGLLHSVLWKLERGLEKAQFSALELATGEAGRIGFADRPKGARQALAAAAVMLRQDALLSVMADASLQWFAGLVATPCQHEVSIVDMTLPEDMELATRPLPQAAAHEMLSFVSGLHASPFRAAIGQTWEWREEGIPWRKRAHEISRERFGGHASFPKVKEAGTDVGILLPIVEFGGVEKVALNIARALRNRGIRVHLFVLEGRDAALTPEWREVFSSVTFLADDRFSVWFASHQKYISTDVPRWALSGDQGAALAMLSWLDAAINFHGGAISGVMGQLRRLGVKTANSLHLNDLSPVGRPAGNTYLGLAFEHAFDLFLPCSEQLGDWCHAMGVPDAKIVPVPNAAGFELPDDDAARLLSTRRSRSGPLNVLYLGRLDRQKGLERLSEVVQATEALDLPVKWRVVGKTVLAVDQAPISPEIGRLIEKPLSDPRELAELFGWADVVVLLSSYEGLPLTVIEAMRQGAIPIVTDVGAVTEVVRNGENGIVVPLEGAARHAIAALDELVRDPGRLRALSDAAVASMEGRNWMAATEALCQRLFAPQPAEKGA